MKRSILTAIAATAAVFGLDSGAPLATQRPPEVPSASERRSARAPLVFEPPAVPAASSTLPPMTLSMTTTSEPAAGGANVARQTVLRTVDRVAVVTDDTHSEWLFERNPVDHRRVSGYLIDHRMNRILIHQDSDLRNGQQVRGWLDVLTLRFDPDVLRGLRRTGETRAVSGVTFDRFVAPDPSRGNLTEVWWSEALLLPARVVVREDSSRTTSTIDEIAEGVDASRLAAPAQRFPSYRILEVTDAREP